MRDRCAKDAALRGRLAAAAPVLSSQGKRLASGTSSTEISCPSAPSACSQAPSQAILEARSRGSANRPLVASLACE